MATDESFLPQIVGLFYATFDPKLGPIVQHQVPEDLITSRSRTDQRAEDYLSQSQTLSLSESRSRSHSRSRSRARIRRRPSPSSSRSHSRHSDDSSNISDIDDDSDALLDFAPISEYVIPKKSLHGKLVTMLTTPRPSEGGDGGEMEEYRIMGFPAIITDEGGGRYKRNEYMWNLCFVFRASSSLEAFEPVVRKCGRILKAAELDSGFLSTPNPDHTSIPAVLEQLFEDLNSYSETSIPLDGFNSLELKLFPFYPNPSDCEDWHVPMALVDFNALKDDNWDITAARVAEYIDGVNHVARIAELADADPALTRETLRHMLYYQVIMMIDIFQYANMYTLKPSITRLAADESIISECGTYITRSGSIPPSWPTLLRLYSKLLPGTTVHQWIEANDVLSLGIDPRRFVSFGIIKGFLKRVHRWPVRVNHTNTALFEAPKITSNTGRRVGFDRYAKSGPSAADSLLTRSGPGDSSLTLRSTETNTSGLSPSSHSHARATPPSNQTQHQHRSPGAGRRPVPMTQMRDSSFGRSLASAGTHPSQLSRRELRLRHDDEVAIAKSLALERYLDGNHHTDEIQIVFRMGWKELEEALGVRGGKGVRIVYR